MTHNRFGWPLACARRLSASTDHLHIVIELEAIDRHRWSLTNDGRKCHLFAPILVPDGVFSTIAISGLLYAAFPVLACRAPFLQIRRNRLLPQVGRETCQSRWCWQFPPPVNNATHCFFDGC